MAPKCSKHGTQYEVIESRPGRSGKRGIYYAGCPDCARERKEGKPKPDDPPKPKPKDDPKPKPKDEKIVVEESWITYYV